MVKRAVIIVGLLLAFVFVLGVGYTVGVYRTFHREDPIPYTSPDADKLRWLDKADVRADFRKQVEEQKDLRFIKIYSFSFSTEYPGLDDTPEMHQLIREHGERQLPDITDIISSWEHKRLNEAAFDYAMRYNSMLLGYLEREANHLTNR